MEELDVKRKKGAPINLGHYNNIVTIRCNFTKFSTFFWGISRHFTALIRIGGALDV